MSKLKFYVYIHRDPNGNIFYVGKGSGRRAWEAYGRHFMWENYIKRFNGAYIVEIVRKDLEEEAALYLEEQLLNKYSGQLVNWINMGRGIDVKKIDKANSLRKQLDGAMKLAKATESKDLHTAINFYLQALEYLIQINQVVRFEKFTGIALEVYNEFFDKEGWFGNIEVLDRLTVCQKKAGLYAELIAVVEKYQRRFPSSLNLATMSKQIMGRVKFAKDKSTQRC